MLKNGWVTGALVPVEEDVALAGREHVSRMQVGVVDARGHTRTPRARRPAPRPSPPARAGGPARARTASRSSPAARARPQPPPRTAAAARPAAGRATPAASSSSTCAARAHLQLGVEREHPLPPARGRRRRRAGFASSARRRRCSIHRSPGSSASTGSTCSGSIRCSTRVRARARSPSAGRFALKKTSPAARRRPQHRRPRPDLHLIGRPVRLETGAVERGTRSTPRPATASRGAPTAAPRAAAITKGRGRRPAGVEAQRVQHRRRHVLDICDALGVPATHHHKRVVPRVHAGQGALAGELWFAIAPFRSDPSCDTNTRSGARSTNGPAKACRARDLLHERQRLRPTAGRRAPRDTRGGHGAAGLSPSRLR